MKGKSMRSKLLLRFSIVMTVLVSVLVYFACEAGNNTGISNSTNQSTLDRMVTEDRVQFSFNYDDQLTGEAIVEDGGHLSFERGNNLWVIYLTKDREESATWSLSIEHTNLVSGASTPLRTIRGAIGTSWSIGNEIPFIGDLTLDNEFQSLVDPVLDKVTAGGSGECCVTCNNYYGSGTTTACSTCRVTMDCGTCCAGSCCE